MSDDSDIEFRKAGAADLPSPGLLAMVVRDGYFTINQARAILSLADRLTELEAENRELRRADGKVSR